MTSNIISLGLLLTLLSTNRCFAVSEDSVSAGSGGRRGGLQSRAGSFDGVIEGVVLLPESLKSSLNSIGVQLYTSQGTVLRSFCGPDGTFVFGEVPVGSHLLHVNLLGVAFGETKLEVTSRAGLVRASVTDGGPQFVGGRWHPLPSVSPLIIRPLGVFQYLEKRKPFDLRGLLTSPYGLMVGFSVLAIFVFPRLKVDPQEYKEMQQTLRGGTGSAGGAASSAATRRE